MRPEISQLLAFIYPSLTDHESTEGRGGVAGVRLPVFFLQGAMGDARSRTNAHEAAFLAALAHWLVRCGHAAESLTVLTLQALRQAFAKVGPQLGGCVLRSVDQYQGEENEVVLLSLVRSNAEGSIGFLGVDNRVC
ncbi:hypothetical protein T492DRAFT_916359, partial [Pavlovales sp. CCMP2436]